MGSMILSIYHCPHIVKKILALLIHLHLFFRPFRNILSSAFKHRTWGTGVLSKLTHISAFSQHLLIIAPSLTASNTELKAEVPTGADCLPLTFPRKTANLILGSQGFTTSLDISEVILTCKDPRESDQGIQGTLTFSVLCSHCFSPYYLLQLSNPLGLDFDIW